MDKITGRIVTDQSKQATDLLQYFFDRNTTPQYYKDAQSH